MTLTKSVCKIKEFIYTLSRGINSIGVVLLMGMMLLIVVDVFLRLVCNQPIMGAYEIVQFIMMILVYLGLASTAVQKVHIGIDLMVARFSERTRAFVDSLTLLLGFGFFALVTWRNILRARVLLLENETSFLLSIPTFPFYYILAFGCGVLCLVLLVQLIETIAKVYRLFAGIWIGPMYALASVIIWIPFAVAVGWLEIEMNSLTAGIWGIMILFILMAAGMPIAFAMGLVGLAGWCYIVGVDAAFGQLETTPFGVGSEYILSVVPLFLLMGQFAFHSGLSEELYDTSYKWLGQYPGGLAMATVGGCAAFAAVSGSGVATAATMGTVALPAMKKYQYSTRLALGSLAAGGTIGILIPPSIVFILYGILTEQSIGKLFLAGLLPGVLTVIIYVITILLQVRLNPKLGPPGPATKLKEKMASLRQTRGMLALFILVMGGIYLGFFTPTEAGAVGAFGAFLLALLRKKINWKILYACLLYTGRTTAMLIIIFVGAMLFNYFLALSELPEKTVRLITDLALNRYGVLTAILLMYLLLGCVMDSGSMIILTIPIVYPIIKTFGFDPIWFGVIIVMVAEIGAITPPVGLNVFVLNAIAPEVPVSEIFRGILPFWGADMIRLTILVMIPEISLFLPNIMK
ncbi:TRAP dicarboxylate transporter, DctM subunit, unknown substrate 3 [Olavius sp. associated proteobacterium Delta 1]|nr:TRAP dicarboxylate transporter, DctM subunit, unknown substrate 3 [Olavius sp. associated proteobacterium Delta 1]